MFKIDSNSITQKLVQFEPVSLDVLGESFLLKRQERKYFFHLQKLSDVLDLFSKDYTILEIDGRRVSKYKSTYLDTPDLCLYHKHHNQHKNRYKFRFREYIESGKTFFEIKHKTNTNFTDKSRILSNSTYKKVDEQIAQFILENTPYNAKDLQTSITVEYDRITLAHKSKACRITIDRNLFFSNNGDNKEYHSLVILEHKYENSQDNYEVMRTMGEVSIFPNRISKYCLGVLNLYKQVKTNLFKQKLRQVDKIECYEVIY